MAGTVLRNGPANGMRMNLPMKAVGTQVHGPVIRQPFSRTARRDGPCPSQFIGGLKQQDWANRRVESAGVGSSGSLRENDRSRLQEDLGIFGLPGGAVGG